MIFMGLSNFDIFILFLFLFCTVTGLIRGFIRELFSLTNWILSFYLLTLIKPFFSNYFAELIKIPFLADIILNISIFVIVLIIISIISKYIAELFKKIMPYNLDITLGFLFGILKAYVILILITSTISVLYNKKEPEILNNSIFSKIFYKNELTNSRIKILLGDFLNEKEHENKFNENEKKQVTIEEEDNSSKNIDIMEKNIDNINNNEILNKKNIDELDNKIENILKKL